jgi:hypothetical protein
MLDIGSLVKAYGTLREIWSRRMWLQLGRQTKEEHGEYRRLLNLNAQVWDEYLNFRRDNPDSLYNNHLYGSMARPFHNAQLKQEDVDGLALLKHFHHYLEGLARVLARYRWQQDFAETFTLLLYRGADPNGDMCLKGFERHCELLTWMLQRGRFKDAARKAEVMRYRRENPILS